MASGLASPLSIIALGNQTRDVGAGAINAELALSSNVSILRTDGIRFITGVFGRPLAAGALRLGHVTTPRVSDFGAIDAGGSEGAGGGGGGGD